MACLALPCLAVPFVVPAFGAITTGDDMLHHIYLATCDDLDFCGGAVSSIVGQVRSSLGLPPSPPEVMAVSWMQKIGNSPPVCRPVSFLCLDSCLDCGNVLFALQGQGDQVRRHVSGDERSAPRRKGGAKTRAAVSGELACSCCFLCWKYARLHSVHTQSLHFHFIFVLVEQP